ncbi:MULTISPECIES: uracil-DNA glycosylase [unclassified Thermoactinomyces]|jgi:uracil-DNA glycosylase|uniref:uracil-DNA glycosylase n=1 Tax=unclassified Thermoactinomyces TaxID=2634588 RepID=UPI0018DC3654|nr:MULTISPECIES: uracil-DNA glycosylase [unclassified Thermoactinomyces]MBH8597725.1 uracil-DNA glycosylase [Thermoactinomyces sp. CICC 10523]MBH8604067.1 uracil-DNA glycosylase [Thermoactinomyces sp. CICC 10522]
MDLQMIFQRYRNCRMCPLHTRRTQVVIGEGNPHSPLMIVGEGPGADEDRQGRPFVGRAGQLLNKILQAAEIPREEIYITNIVKCRPPGNRTPHDEEMATCIQILRQQFLVIRPKIIVTLGSAPTRALIDPRARITRVRGKWVEKKGVRFMPTFHPAYLLRNPAAKREAWEDFKQIRDAYRMVLTQERGGGPARWKD